jgi:glycosyltransferase involved in cell wall biosynthesis
VSRVHLSGAVVCQDNATSIGTVLDCLALHCDEIVVVDGGSRDETGEIAAKYDKVRLFERRFDSHAAQKNFAFDQARGEWLLVLDSDELLGGRGLGRLRWLTRLPGVSWYALPRYWLVERDGALHYLAAKPYYRDRQLRLFRNTAGFRYREDQHPVHHEFRNKRGFGRPLRRPHIFHYTLLMQDRASRERKVARYRGLDPEAERLHRMYLWEDHEVPLLPLTDLLPGMLAGPRR